MVADNTELIEREPLLVPCCSTIGETIPIRLFLGGFDLTPTFRDVNKKFSVRYYLNLVLIDSENRRYFKGAYQALSPSGMAGI
jgi:hypothetical protein